MITRTHEVSGGVSLDKKSNHNQSEFIIPPPPPATPSQNSSPQLPSKGSNNRTVIIVLFILGVCAFAFVGLISLAALWVSNGTESLDKQAISSAESEWAKVWIYEDNTWTAEANIPSRVEGLSGPYLVQIKGRQVEVNPQPLTDADRLNGIQWIGTVNLFCAAERELQLDSRITNGWGKWRDRGVLADMRRNPVDSLQLMKMNDRWIVPSRPKVPNGYTYTAAVRPTLSPLPR